jgi:hypothetical protein
LLIRDVDPESRIPDTGLKRHRIPDLHPQQNIQTVLRIRDQVLF